MSKIRLLILLAAIIPNIGIYAQKTLNLDTEAWEAVSATPTVTKTLTPTSQGYEVTYQFHKALVIPNQLMNERDNWYLEGLTNGSKLPVAFSMACSTGDFSSKGCFAEKMLTYENGGVAAMYAFTNSTYIAYTDVIAAALYSGMYPTINYKPYINWNLDKITITPTFENDLQITELGTLDCYAKNMVVTSFPNNELNKGYKEYEISMLTLFGDPSMNIYLNKPSQIRADATIKSNRLYVTSSEDDAIITLYNRETGNVSNYKGKISGAYLPNYSSITISVHKPGYLPYIKNFSETSKIVASPKPDNQIVTENKIWTYHQDFSAFMEPSENISMNVRFSGTTEINGKTYYNCYAYKSENEFNEADAPVIAYMREEGNSVYAYYKLPDDMSSYQDIIDKYGIDVMATGPTTIYDSNCNDCEHKIFDFSLDAGKRLWFNNEEIDSKSAFVSVLDVFETEYNGNIFLTQTYSSDFGKYYAYQGIGASTGLLPFPGATSIDYGHTPFELTKVTDLEGNVIFESDKLSVAGVKSPDYTSRIIESRYCDLQGRRYMSKPTNGIYIRTDIYNDGTSKVSRHVAK